MRYVDRIGARAVVPSAGPPAFLDDELWHLNVIRGDEPSIFPDQRSFLARLAAAGHRGILAVPGTEIDVTPDEIVVRHPVPDEEVAAIFEDKEDYLRRYQADWRPWLDDLKAGWQRPPTDLVATLRAWWEPLLRMAPTLCAAVGANCLLVAGELEILVDFPHAQVRAYDGEPYSFRFRIPRELVETVAAERAVDWSNSLFLSARFSAWREGDFNEYLYNFFKSLSVERMRRTEAEAVRKLAPPTETEPEIELGGYVVQRRCPHRNADLSVFGEIERGDGGDVLVCTLHGWVFDCETGRCLTSQDHPLSIRRAT
jgi:UDP-MurNAc hydroxylase